MLSCRRFYRWILHGCPHPDDNDREPCIVTKPRKPRWKRHGSRVILFIIMASTFGVSAYYLHQRKENQRDGKHELKTNQQDSTETGRIPSAHPTQPALSSNTSASQNQKQQFTNEPFAAESGKRPSTLEPVEQSMTESPSIQSIQTSDAPSIVPTNTYHSVNHESPNGKPLDISFIAPASDYLNQLFEPSAKPSPEIEAFGWGKIEAVPTLNPGNDNPEVQAASPLPKEVIYSINKQQIETHNMTLSTNSENGRDANESNSNDIFPSIPTLAVNTNLYEDIKNKNICLVYQVETLFYSNRKSKTGIELNIGTSYDCEPVIIASEIAQGINDISGEAKDTNITDQKSRSYRKIWTASISPWRSFSLPDSFITQDLIERNAYALSKRHWYIEYDRAWQEKSLPIIHDKKIVLNNFHEVVDKYAKAATTEKAKLSTINTISPEIVKWYVRQKLPSNNLQHYMTPPDSDERVNNRQEGRNLRGNWNLNLFDPKIHEFKPRSSTVYLFKSETMPSQLNAVEGKVLMVKVNAADIEVDVFDENLYGIVLGSNTTNRTQSQYISLKQQYMECSRGLVNLIPYQNAAIPASGVMTVKVSGNASTYTYRSIFSEANLLVLDQLGLAESGESLSDYVQHAIFIIPNAVQPPPGTLPGIGQISMAGTDSYMSVVSDLWINNESIESNKPNLVVLLRTTGNNRGLGSAWESGDMYGDTTGAMGRPIEGVSKVCFNGIMFEHLGWMLNKTIRFDPFLCPSRRIDLVSFTNYNATEPGQVVNIRVNDYSLTYNRKKDYNSDTPEYADKVLVHQRLTFITNAVHTSLRAALDLNNTVYTYVEGGIDIAIELCSINEGIPDLGVPESVTVAFGIGELPCKTAVYQDGEECNLPPLTPSPVTVAPSAPSSNPPITLAPNVSTAPSTNPPMSAAPTKTPPVVSVAPSIPTMPSTNPPNSSIPPTATSPIESAVPSMPTNPSTNPPLSSLPPITTSPAVSLVPGIPTAPSTVPPIASATPTAIPVSTGIPTAPSTTPPIISAAPSAAPSTPTFPSTTTPISLGPILEPNKTLAPTTFPSSKSPSSFTFPPTRTRIPSGSPTVTASPNTFTKAPTGSPIWITPKYDPDFDNLDYEFFRCEDFTSVRFFLDERLGFRTCNWLKENLSEPYNGTTIKNTFCTSENLAYTFCEQTCGKCIPGCEQNSITCADDPSSTFIYMGNEHSCEWLVSCSHLIPLLCERDNVRSVCQKTCKVC